MNITKDEARILRQALCLSISDLVSDLPKVQACSIAIKLFELEVKLAKAGKDFRRQGRRSRNDFNDCLKRYSKINQEKKVGI